MNKEKIILILVTIILLTGACSKKEKEYPTYYLGQEYKDYVVYKVGSYWIYQDSVSKMIDSVYLFKQNITIHKGGQKIPFNSELLEENKASSLSDTLLTGGGIGYENKGALYREAQLNDFINSNINYFEGEIGEFAVGTVNTKYSDKRDSLIFGQKFFDVKIFQNIQQEFSYQPKKTYYAKHVGLIRKELFNGQVWNLIRYKVSQ